MNVLIYSPLFHPSVGGLEMVILILAHKFIDFGHSVKVVSQTPTQETDSFPFEVIRQPDAFRLLDLTRWCDIYFQGCVSLKGIWPLLLVRKPLAVTHQTWYSRLDGSLSWQDHLKHFITRFAINIAASQSLAECLPVPSQVIPNPYRDDIFEEMPEIKRDRELVFLGRLVSDKGADLLLQALGRLKALNMFPLLTLIGQGPEAKRLQEQARDLGVADQVNFAGIKTGQELAQLLNAHQILVAPSRWREPFGIVALEGIACGCVVIGSEGGGLKDAIGTCGVTFPNGDVERLTQILADFLTNPEKLLVYRQQAASHLLRHTRAEVAKSYLKVFERAIL